MSRPRNHDENLPVGLYTRLGVYRIFFRGRYFPLGTADKDEAIKRYWKIQNGLPPQTYRLKENERKRGRANKAYEYPKVHPAVNAFLSGGPR